MHGIQCVCVCVCVCVLFLSSILATFPLGNPDEHNTGDISVKVFNRFPYLRSQQVKFVLLSPLPSNINADPQSILHKY